jgi:hypothetical protein
MKAILTFIVVANLSVSAATAANIPPSNPNVIEPLPRDLEIQLALSALPPHLRNNATVYVLNPNKGFEVARSGTNGFYAFVSRIGDDTFRGTWQLKKYRDDILYPISFDEAGVKAGMQVFFDAASLQAKGTAPEKLKETIQERYKTGYYKAPARPGVSYMESPILRTYITPYQNDSVATETVPHIMHYAPNLSNNDVGGAPPTPDQLHYFTEHGHYRSTPSPFVIMPGMHGYFIQFLGVSERDAVVKEYKPMLAQLCNIRAEWCLPEAPSQGDARKGANEP